VLAASRRRARKRRAAFFYARGAGREGAGGARGEAPSVTLAFPTDRRYGDRVSIRRLLSSRARLPLAVLASLALAGSALAAPPPTSPLPPLLQSLAARGKVEVVSQFATEVPGITGYVVRHEGTTDLVYGAHGYLFIGHLFTPKGVDLNASYRDRYVPKPDLGAVVRKLDGAGHLISEGRSRAPLMYVFADPNCSICYRFYHMAEPLVAAGRLQLKWVMVAFLQSTSTARATAILSASNPDSALHFDEDRFDVAHESGGIAPAATTDKALAGVLDAHLTAMNEVGGIGTPTLLYRDSHGQWAVEVGLPSNGWLEGYAPAVKR
jgi:thiol:disulfide interchange protein DsbG